MKKTNVVVIGLASVLTLAACGSPAKLVKSIVGKSTVRNLLTNLPGENGPVLAVKIDDTPDAHPQIGLVGAHEKHRLCLEEASCV